MIYRYEDPDCPSNWFERKEIPGDDQHYYYRSNTITTWIKNLTNGMDIKAKTSAFGFVLVSTRTDDGFTRIDPNDLPKVINKFNDKHKCYCSWELIWREGCKCKGV